MYLDARTALGEIGGCGCAVEDEYRKVREKRVGAVVKVDFAGHKGQ